MTGIAFSDEYYQQQLANKQAYITDLFSGFKAPAAEVYSSAASGFRMRAEFKIWHEGKQAHYAMYEPGKYKKPYIIEQFQQGSARINELMPQLLAEINASEILRKKLFQAEFLTTLAGEALITLIYHKKLDDNWLSSAQGLIDTLGVHLIGRSRKQKQVLGQDFVTERMTVNQRHYDYQQIESSFTQPNAEVCQKMLQWAVDKTVNNGGDLLELYCGNGNFTLPLAHNFNRVLATELAKSSVNSARYNMALNQVENIDIVRMSSEEFSEALDKVRPFRRLATIDLDSYNFSTLLVDPPRAGLDPHTTAIAQRFDNIVYISCNPATLKRDLEVITQTHNIKHFALFDQFPFTDHIECGVCLVKRD
ncbi:MAG TPA: tRNA (uridine(54)-C5)-methyltransferase TrmA [Cellvibrionaceae bacterium]